MPSLVPGCDSRPSVAQSDKESAEGGAEPVGLLLDQAQDDERYDQDADHSEATRDVHSTLVEREDRFELLHIKASRQRTRVRSLAEYEVIRL